LSVRPKPAWRAAAALGLLFNVFLGLSEISRSGPLAFWSGKMNRDAYLESRVPAYPMYRLAGRLREPGEKIYLLHMKNYGYWLDPPWEADFVFERYRLEAALAGDPSEGAAERFFAARGASLLLVNFAPLDDPDGGSGAGPRRSLWVPR
jgi:hypothetical protein